MNKSLLAAVAGAASVLMTLSAQIAVAGPDKVRAEAYFNAISGGNPDTIASFYADNAEFHWVGGPLAGIYSGKTQIKAVWKRFTEAAGDIDHKVMELSESQNGKRSTVTARVNFIGPKEVPVKFIMIYENGKIVREVWQVDKPVAYAQGDAKPQSPAKAAAEPAAAPAPQAEQRVAAAPQAAAEPQAPENEEPGSGEAAENGEPEQDAPADAVAAAAEEQPEEAAAAEAVANDPVAPVAAPPAPVKKRVAEPAPKKAYVEKKKKVTKKYVKRHYDEEDYEYDEPQYGHGYYGYSRGYYGHRRHGGYRGHGGY